MTFATKRKILNVTRYITLGFVSVIMLYPLLWMIAAIWRSNIAIWTEPGLIPSNPVSGWDNIVYGWTVGGRSLLFYFGNTLRFLIPRVIGQVISCVLTAYAITRFHFKGKKIVFSLVIITLLMPEVIFRIPMFHLFQQLRLFGPDAILFGGFAPLWLENWFATGSFFVFMLVQFMRTIPKDLDEAAKIDGCNSFQTLIFVLLPVMKPAIITVGLLTFMWGMNDFLGPLIYIRPPEQRVLQQALRMATDPTGEAALNWGGIFAMSVMALLPAIIVFFSAQRYFIDGIASTGSKE